MAGSLDRQAKPFDRALARAADPHPLAVTYGEQAAPTLKAMFPLSNNMRVVAIYLACLAGNPRLFWWLELLPLSVLTAAAILWHLRVEARLLSAVAVEPG